MNKPKLKSLKDRLYSKAEMPVEDIKVEKKSKKETKKK